MKLFSPLKSGAFTLLAIAISCSAFAEEENTIWELDIPGFQISDSPYEGWKLSAGEAIVDAESEPPLLHMSAGTDIYRYLPFYDAFHAGSEHYLQMHTDMDDPETYGASANVSEKGSHLGAFTHGITTYNLLQHPYFSENTSVKKNWAFRFWSSKPFRLKGISLKTEVSDGIIIQTEQNNFLQPPASRDKLRVTLHTTDTELRKQNTIEAEVIIYAQGEKTGIFRWQEEKDATVVLTKVREGVFTGTITLNEMHIAFLHANKSPTLGVRVLEATTPLTGWIFFPVLGEKKTGAIDWQFRIGDDTNSHAEWRKLTEGTELASGKRLRYIPNPDYRLTTDENDPFDLTDGELSSRKDDRIWFQKDAVGWYGAGGGIDMATILVDLEEVQPVGQIAIRLLAGKEQNGLRLPNALEFYASEDGETWHILQTMQKLMPAERALSDFKTAFYVPEEGSAFVHAFACKEPVLARHIAIRILPEASAFTDQISILKAEESSPAKPLASYPVTTFFSDGMVARPRQPEFTIFPNVHAHNWIMLESYLEEPYSALKVQIELPPGIQILPSTNKALEIQKVSTESSPDNIWEVANAEKIKAKSFPVYLEKTSDTPLAENAEITLTAYVDGAPSHVLRYPLRERALPEGPFTDSRDISLAWMGEQTQIEWPDFFTEFRQLGFNYISTFPRYWQNRNANRTWLENGKQKGLKLIADARSHGYKVVMNDSPFHEMMHTAAATRKENLSTPEYEKGFFLKNANGELTESPNPFYRGYHYQKEIDRIKELVKQTTPDHVYWDIELWWRSVRMAKADADVAKQWQDSGKEWDEFVTDAGTEMLRDLYNAVKEGMGDKPMPEIGLYGAYAAQAHPTDGLFQWSKIYPDYITISMPSLYVQGRVADVSSRIKNDYPLVQENIIPWLTAATYGAVAPASIESMILETLLNGAQGVTYYQYADFDPLHLYYQTRALATLGKFPDLLQTGAPKDASWKGDNPALSYTCFASDSEALILIGNYSRTSDNQTAIPPIFPHATTTEIREGNILSSPTANDAKIEVPPGEFILLHQKRTES